MYILGFFWLNLTRNSMLKKVAFAFVLGRIHNKSNYWQQCLNWSQCEGILTDIFLKIPHNLILLQMWRYTPLDGFFCICKCVVFFMLIFNSSFARRECAHLSQRKRIQSKDQMCSLLIYMTFYKTILHHWWFLWTVMVCLPCFHFICSFAFVTSVAWSLRSTKT
jgi:hypothetical protein